jgi:hypothetical protein
VVRRCSSLFFFLATITGTLEGVRERENQMLCKWTTLLLSDL